MLYQGQVNGVWEIEEETQLLQDWAVSGKASLGERIIKMKSK